jgi:hypothetical protein
MVSQAKIIVDVQLDDETLNEINMLRSIRLAHYEQMVASPSEALATLVKAGLLEESNPEQIAAKASAKVNELKARIAHPNVIYDDELTIYIDTLSVDED